MSALPVSYVEGNLAFCTDGTTWAGYLVEPNSYEFLTETDKWAEHDRMLHLLWNVVEEGMLVRLCHETSVADYIALVSDLTFTEDDALQKAYKKRLDELSRYLEDNNPQQRSYYLFLRLPLNDGTSSGDEAVLGQISSRLEVVKSGIAQGIFGVDRTRISEKEIEKAQNLERRYRRHACHCLWAEPMSFTDWIVYIQRLHLRGLTEGRPPITPVQYAAKVEGDEVIVRPSKAQLVGNSNALIEEHKRHIAVESDSHGTSYQSYLCVYDYPEIEFPGDEWIYRLETLSFPVDVCIRFRCVRALDALRKAQSDLKKIEGQILHIAESGDEVPVDLLESEDKAKSYIYETKKTKAPEVWATTTFCIYSNNEDKCTQRGDELKNYYSPQQIKIARPLGEQYPAFESFLPGSRGVSAEYSIPMPPGFLSAAIFFCTEHVGDSAGPYIGHVVLGSESDDAPTGTPVLYDPTWAPLNNRSSVVGVLGTLGGGKSEMVKRLVDWLLLRGAQGIVYDPKGEYGVYADHPNLADMVQVVRLSADSKTIFDPLITPSFELNAAGQVASSFLCMLAEADINEQILISKAVEAEKGVASPSLVGVVERLISADPDTEVSQRLGHYMTLPLARLAFGSPDTSTTDLSTSLDRERLTVIDMRGLQLPDRESHERKTFEQSLSLALLYLVVSVGQAFVRNNVEKRPRFIVIDEAWALTRTTEGRNLIFEIDRLSRSAFCVPILITQSASDLGKDAELTGRMSTRFVFRQESTAEARQCLKFLGYEEPPTWLIELLQNLPTGQCLMMDVHGRLAHIQIDQTSEELSELFDTRPISAKDKKKQRKKRRRRERAYA